MAQSNDICFQAVTDFKISINRNESQKNISTYELVLEIDKRKADKTEICGTNIKSCIALQTDEKSNVLPSF